MKNTPVIKLLTVVWKHTQDAGKSWQRLNAALQDALNIAIDHGFTFDRKDFVAIAENFRPGYWMGYDGEALGERFYARAVEGARMGSGRAYPNLSAAQAFEEWKGRKPYIVKGRRLALGSRVRHPEHGVLHVTSIDEEKIGACWYDNPGNHQQGKPAKRFQFTHKTVKSEGLS